MCLPQRTTVPATASPFSHGRRDRNGLPGAGWARAGKAVNAGQHLYEQPAADPAVASIESHAPSSVAESLRLVDIRAGRLAELASGPGDPQIRAALADLRDEVDRLRTCVNAARMMISSVTRLAGAVTALEDDADLVP
jgi:hypothetical protein